MVRLIFPGRFKSTRGRGAFAATDSMRRLCQESRHFPSFGPFRVHFLARIHLFWSYHTVSTRGFAGEGATGQVAMLRPFLEFPATVPFPRLWATDVHTSHPQECDLVVNSVYPGCRARPSPVARRPPPPSPLPHPSLAPLCPSPPLTLPRLSFCAAEENRRDQGVPSHGAPQGRPLRQDYEDDRRHHQVQGQVLQVPLHPLCQGL